MSELGKNFYSAEYARRYIEGTLQSKYTVYKNRLIANEASRVKTGQVLDLGGCVSGLIRQEGSLRYQCERKGITYTGLDLSPAYFDKGLASAHGIADSDIYPDVRGVVGDIRELPFRDGSVPFVVCADVIEHIEHPDKALQEMNRVLQPGGEAVVVVPSLYKLDAVKLSEIEARRKSSHENKLDLKEWVSLYKGAGFEFEPRYSRPIGIATGLSYLLWLDTDFVPEKPSVTGKEAFSEKAGDFKKAKEFIGRYDPIIDTYLLQLDGQSDMVHIVECLHQRNVPGVLGSLRNVLCRYMDTDELALVDKTFGRFNTERVDPNNTKDLAHMVQEVAWGTGGVMHYGNSALMVLKKPA